ncbi:MAG: shikimate kinase [Candidatus Bathyarchaeia archaeon]
MAGFGEAEAHGAATIVNAIATGRGAAFGVALKTTARVTLTNEAGIVRGRIIGDEGESTKLIERAVLLVLERFGGDNRYGASVETESSIPIARGLKSSSTAANATVLATAAALGELLDDLTAVNLSVEAAIEAGVTITGAFDDACASFLGGVIVTDNLRRQILKRYEFDDEYIILFLIPPKKAYTSDVNLKRVRLIAPQVELALREALLGNYWHALTLNGLLHAAALGYDPGPAIDALEAGALASGLSGKGPATVAVVLEENANAVAEAWRPYAGQVVQTMVNRRKASVVRME